MRLLSFFSMVAWVLVSCNPGSGSTDNVYYRIEAKHSGKSLTLSFNRPLQTIGDTTNAGYTWQIKNLTDSVVQIISVVTGEAIELPATGDHVFPYVTQSDSSELRQQFILSPLNDESVYLEPVSKPGYCLDISESDTADFAVILTWSKEGNPNQRWVVHRTGEYYTIMSALNNKFLSVTPALNVAGANISQWAFSGREEQIWILNKNDDGSYLIQNKFSEMYLQESDGKESLKDNVHQSPDKTSKKSLWRLDETGEGWIKFRNVDSGFCMDVRDAASYDGANVMTYDCNDGGDNQYWKLIPVTE